MKWNRDKVEARLSELTYPGTRRFLGFDWRPCYLCQRNLGGDRYELTHKDGVESICIDCALYTANGEEPYEEESV